MKHIFSFFAGLVFGLGLLLTGMYSMDIVLAGLKIGASTFKINLYLTFVSALVVTFLLYQLRHYLKTPLSHSCYVLPTVSQLDWRLITGAVLFGIGWGIAGLCPGPNIVGLGIYSWPVYWINFSGMIVGFVLVKIVLKLTGRD